MLILSDESINSYGFRVLTSGIDLTAYKKNPIVLYNHNRNGGVIGKGVNVGVKNGELVADKIDFYEGNEYAADVKRKYEGGFLNAFSIGFQVLETSDNEKDLITGQKYATVTKSKLIEFSIVEMPSNTNAVRLYDENMVELSISEFTLDPKGFQKPLGSGLEKQTKNLISMKNLFQKLGLAENATETQAIEALEKRDADLSEKLTAKLSANTNKVIEKYVKFENEEKAKSFKTLAALDFDAALTLLGETTLSGDKTEGKKTETTQVSFLDILKELKGGNTTEKVALLSWDDYQKNDPKGLQELQTNDFEKFSELYKSKYGKPAPVK